jgi:hypothetical protein
VRADARLVSMGASVLLVNDDCPNVKNAFLFMM